MIRVTVWNEFYHETISEEIRAVYPQGIHRAIADFLAKNEDMSVRTALMEEEENGLTDEVLENTDVLLWWSHVCHDKVSDAVAEKVQARVLKGMGFIPAPFVAHVQTVPAPDGHRMHAEMAGRR